MGRKKVQPWSLSLRGMVALSSEAKTTPARNCHALRSSLRGRRACGNHRERKGKLSCAHVSLYFMLCVCCWLTLSSTGRGVAPFRVWVCFVVGEPRSHAPENVTTSVETGGSVERRTTRTAVCTVQRTTRIALLLCGCRRPPACLRVVGTLTAVVRAWERAMERQDELQEGARCSSCSWCPREFRCLCRCVVSSSAVSLRGCA